MSFTIVMHSLKHNFICVPHQITVAVEKYAAGMLPGAAGVLLVFCWCSAGVLVCMLQVTV